MFAKLNDNDKKAISEYIERYAPMENTPEASNRASLETVLQPWADAKEYLFHLFGDKFIIERQVEYPVDVEEIEDKVYKALNYNDPEHPIRKFRTNFYEALTTCPNLIPNRYGLMELMRPVALASNKFEYDNIVLKDLNGKELKVPNGCKSIKMLGKLAKAFNIEGFEEFRIALSMITNQKNLHGTLCLSIHPLDYMTMSDNDYDWESCMSWKNRGCYRQGTVEMMNSPYAVVAYLRGDTDMRLFGYGTETLWSNKKWRELFIIHPSVVSEVKGYPYQSTMLVDKVLEWIRELQEEHGVHYDTETYETYGSGPIRNHDGDKVRIEFWTHNMYNDFGSMDRGHRCIINFDAIGTDFSLCYSGVSECMWCGDTNPSLPCEEGLVCEECEQTMRCDNCGSYGWNEEDFIEIDGVWMCPDCYENSARQDDIHSTPYNTVEHIDDNMLRITLAHNNDEAPEFNWYDMVIRTYYDFSCDADDFFKFFVHGADDIHTWDGPWGNRKHYVFPKDLTEDGWVLFGLEDEADRVDYLNKVNP